MASGPMLIVIGGSAGALDPLLALVAALPARPSSAVGARSDTAALAPLAPIAPIAIVVHVGTQTPSRLVGILAHVTTLRVREPDDKTVIQPGHIYVAPPNYHLLVEQGGTFALSVDAPVSWSRPSIDVLFESAAFAYGAGTTGIVLSGANEDGALGLARIAAAGGRAIVQDPSSAVYPTMPNAALRSARGARACSIDRLATAIFEPEPETEMIR